MKSLAVVVIAAVLVAVGINASDNIGNFSASLIGSLFGKSQTEIIRSRCPDEMVFISSSGGGFCIDKYENSPADSCLNKNPGNQAETRANLELAECKPVSVVFAAPWVNISQNQAVLACSKAGKRLPTNAEWYAAGLGTPDKNSDWTKDDCNIAGTGASNADKTGSRKNCVSSSGAYDMVGNIWEWVQETISDGVYKDRKLPDNNYVSGVDSEGVPYQTGPEPDLNYNKDYFWVNYEGVNGMFRGGFWGKSSDMGLYSIYAASPPSFVGIAVGFRCVK